MDDWEPDGYEDYLDHDYPDEAYETDPETQALVEIAYGLLEDAPELARHVEWLRSRGRADHAAQLDGRYHRRLAEAEGFLVESCGPYSPAGAEPSEHVAHGLLIDAHNAYYNRLEAGRRAFQRRPGAPAREARAPRRTGRRARAHRAAPSRRSSSASGDSGSDGPGEPARALGTLHDRTRVAAGVTR